MVGYMNVVDVGQQMDEWLDESMDVGWIDG